jgi:hypothetical protein
MVLSLGYLEERGWLTGRSAYAQMVARPIAPLRFLVRGSWARGDTLGIDRDEIGVYASGSADLTRLLALRLSLHGRTTLGDGEGGAPHGLTGFATVVAGF